MAKIPIKSGREIIRAFEKAGYENVRQLGSHVRMKHLSDSGKRPISIPLHKTVKPGLLAKAIKDAGLTIPEFTELL